MGALTSKVYSFSLRPWELKVIETFDFIDSWVSSIFLNTRGSKIIRILPRVTTLCTETFWISDKTRFFFDALTFFRIQLPSVFYNKLKFDVSWYKVLNFLNFIFLKVFYLNVLNSIKFLVNFFDGVFFFRKKKLLDFVFFRNDVFDFEDIKTSFYKSFFYNFFWFNKFYNFQNYISRKTYFFNGNNQNNYFRDFKHIFLISTNLRIEFPILLLLLRKLVNTGCSKVFVFGDRSFSYFNFFFTFMGNSFLEFFTLLKGKHIYSYLLFERYLFLIGESLKYRVDLKNLFSFLFYKNFNFKVLTNNIGSLNFFDVGSLFFDDCMFSRKINSLALKFCGDDYKIKKNNSKDFIVFLGSHVSKSFFNCDVILPTTLGYEYNLVTNNLFGERKKLEQLFKFNNYDTRPSWKIFEIFFFKFLDILYIDNDLDDILNDIFWNNYDEAESSFFKISRDFNCDEYRYSLSSYTYSSYNIFADMFCIELLKSKLFRYLKDLMRSCYSGFYNFNFNENYRVFFFFNTLIENPIKKYRDLNFITRSSRILGLIDKFSIKYSFNFFKF